MSTSLWFSETILKPEGILRDSPRSSTTIKEWFQGSDVQDLRLFQRGPEHYERMMTHDFYAAATSK